MQQGSATDVFENFLQFVRTKEAAGEFTKQEQDHLHALVLVIRLFIDYHQVTQTLDSIRVKKKQ